MALVRQESNGSALEQRFKVSDVLQAAKHDEHLRRLLEVLGLYGARESLRARMKSVWVT